MCLSQTQVYMIINLHSHFLTNQPTNQPTNQRASQPANQPTNKQASKETNKQVLLNIHAHVHVHTYTYRAAERIQRHPVKRERGGVQAKRTGNFQRLEIYYGKLLLIYPMRPPDREMLGTMRPWGSGGISPAPSRWPCVQTAHTLDCKHNEKDILIWQPIENSSYQSKMSTPIRENALFSDGMICFVM